MKTLNDVEEHSIDVDGRLGTYRYLNDPDHNRIPGDDHPGARYQNPQVRIWEGPAALEGSVTAEAKLNAGQPGLIVEAWAANAEANAMLVDNIEIWARQHGLKP